jgi:hypothetical protein
MTRRPAHRELREPLDPAVVKLLDALARAQAREDHARELADQATRDTAAAIE